MSHQSFFLLRHCSYIATFSPRSRAASILQNTSGGRSCQPDGNCTCHFADVAYFTGVWLFSTDQSGLSSSITKQGPLKERSTRCVRKQSKLRFSSKTMLEHPLESKQLRMTMKMMMMMMLMLMLMPARRTLGSQSGEPGGGRGN